MFKNHYFTKTIKATIIAVGLSSVFQTLPASADSLHNVKEGDTFYLLSQKYNVNLAKLISANPDIEATNIYEGLTIKIPDGKITTNSTNGENNLSSKVESDSTLKVLSTEKVVEAWGKSFNYSDTINVKATAYSAAPGENGKWGAVDFYGNPLKLGTIAVDPKVIPMGTKVLVTGHSHPGLPKEAFVATATDQGGAIKGNRIDIFIPGSASSVNAFGYQDVKLYIID
ncbi:3D domain-containing protein [Paenibacillus segetis]|uniref:LysM domain-containing protein n=1 Tax=Paenibacillus segetis TaxID=1325360 RepID=A0ABQ1YE11_9BACL|nr:3D domain-containing protein [Paenibacillus segetis]GGH22273.1 hypothetical protein GCM10008013_20630 [Paenibacillus segetis]